MNYYGRGVTYKQLLFGGVPKTLPAEAAAFNDGLPSHSQMSEGELHK